MAKINTGGHVFPSLSRIVGDPSNPNGHSFRVGGEDGLTLRDYFAAHAPEPSTGELAKTAGLTVQHNHVSDDDTFLGELHLWWEKLPNTEQLALVAKYRWAYADAMIKAREGGE
ncbi:MAG: hypothetical protein IH622_13470 [Ochrobactrum anthropi]|uniref:Uncharacterized protein n=1 Tax=Brucella anthropi TaxID=529 RepID=A0A8I0N7K5_BRUAN|nr:hypothetical protein [Brucella anthropi]MBE0561806.1 hypothetical protein [Brucella anthropi]